MIWYVCFEEAASYHNFADWSLRELVRSTLHFCWCLLFPLCFKFDLIFGNGRFWFVLGNHLASLANCNQRCLPGWRFLCAPRTYLLELANVLAARAKPEAKETLRLAVKGDGPGSCGRVWEKVGVGLWKREIHECFLRCSWSLHKRWSPPALVPTWNSL